MIGVVTFDPALFIQRFTQFASIDPGVLQMYFDEAALLLNNTPTSVVRDLGERTTLLNLITAHIATLSADATRVGRVASAGEGSVSASLDMGAQPRAAAYWMQTQYGASYWQMSGRHRTMRYILPRCRR